MRYWIIFYLPLLAGIALLTWAATWLIGTTSRQWFERDVSMRAELAVLGARESLIRSWARGRYLEIKGQLEDIARDDRITAAAACSPEGELVIHTNEFPKEIGCLSLALNRDQSGNKKDTSWHNVRILGSRTLFISAIGLKSRQRKIGFVAVVHDMSFAERRARLTRIFTIIVFTLLAAAIMLITLLFTRYAWRRWSQEVRRLIDRGDPTPQFRPIMRDIRELVYRLSSEEESAEDWTPTRLKTTLQRYLHGEQILILANREPYIHEFGDDGTIQVQHPASGLVTALEPVMRACSGVWIAHGSGPADKQVADKWGRISVPPDEKLYTLRRIWLSDEEEKGYYYGFANEGLWPLCHLAHVRPVFRKADWDHYVEINKRFAKAVSEETHVEDPIVWVQDYHFTMAPKMIRRQLPNATILMFWHIPWPNAESFNICPWHAELLEGMLGCDILGFHTQLHCNNFLDSVNRLLEARIDRERQAIIYNGQTTLVRSYPISIEWPSHWAGAAPPPKECRRRVLKDCNLKPNAIIGVGVDRLDYTKGIEERFLAIERTLERYPKFRGRLSFIQLAAPSRSEIDQYHDHALHIEMVAARINARFGRKNYLPIILRKAHHEPAVVFQYFRAANFCYVSSLHDGMNLVAKEFVAARDDERGVLILSRFTGAARELTEALIVNPYNLEETSSAFATAIHMSAEEQQSRMTAMRQLVAKFNVYRWAGGMIIDAAFLRQHERMTSRFKKAGS